MHTHFLSQFFTIVQTYPDKIAISQWERSITYKELRNYAMYIAEDLKAEWIKPRTHLILHFPKSIEYIGCLLGSRMHNCYWTPLTPCSPTKRKEYIIQHSQASFMLSVSKEISSSMWHIIVPFFQNIDLTEKLTDYASPHTDQIAYVIYTSWSTWVPKWVIVSHKWLVNVLEQQIKTFQIDTKSRSLLLLSILFDASISDIWTILLAGGTLYIQEIDAEQFHIDMPRIIKERKITHLDIAPSLLRVLRKEEIWDSLKTIIIWWEVPDPKTIDYRKQYVRLINVYWPTEATICTSMTVCNDIDWDQAYIWEPIDNITYHVWDIQNKSNTWELLISWVWIAIWYLNNDELTQKKFISINDVAYYRTWDVVKKEWKQYIFKWRLDRQIKVRWQLVEIEEVENMIRSYIWVHEVCVLPIQQWTYTYLQSVVFADKDFDVKSLKNHLESHLSSWMIPKKFVVMHTPLPKNMNWKIDYSKIQISTTNNTSLWQLTTLQKQMLHIWEEALQKKWIWIDDDFFDIWWDSLATIEVIVKLQTYNYVLSSKIISEHKTIRNISNHIQDRNMSLGAKNTLLQWKSILPYVLEEQLKKVNNLWHINKKHWLITWSSGFLGSRVLNELLHNTNDDITLILRGNKEEIESKIIQVFNKYKLIPPQDRNERVTIVSWDVWIIHFWLSQTQWESICSNVTDIMHLAAEVNMLKNYKELENNNVKPIFTCLDLASTWCKKTIHYASTLSVFVATSRNTWIASEQDTLKVENIIYWWYAQTKTVAELILHNAKPYINSNIFRLWLLTPDTKHWISSSHDFLITCLKWLSKIGNLPDQTYENLCLDCTPVDYASKILTLTAINSQSWVYHIAHHKWLSLEDITRSLERNRYTIKRIPYKKRKKIINGKMKQDSDIQQTYMSLCRILPEHFEKRRNMDLFQATDIIFDQSNTQKIIKMYWWDISAPVVDENLLDLYIRENLLWKKVSESL